MINIKDMKSGDENVEFSAMISHVTAGKTNGANKTNYLNIVFQDSTGTIDAKLWNATQTQIDTLVNGTVVNGTADIIKYADDRQMKIVSIKEISNDPNNQVNYVAKAPIEKEIMINEIERYINEIENEKLNKITSHLIHSHLSLFEIYPAASRNHHEFVSGLAFHTLSMLKIAESLVHIYPELNKDLMYSGILLHDLGKTIELSGPVVPTYTLEGKLLGHISMSQAMVHEAAKELQIEGEEVILLQHMILSHHGKNEFGSPVLPQIREAEIIYLIDNIDARMNMLNKALEQVEPGDYSKRVYALENRTIYKPKMYEK